MRNFLFSVQPQRFVELTNLILDIFPTEIKETYYVPYRYDNITKEKSLASGKFQNRYHHLRGVLITTGVIEKSQARKKQKTIPNSVRLGFSGNFTSDGCIIIIFIIIIIIILSDCYFYFIHIIQQKIQQKTLRKKSMH